MYCRAWYMPYMPEISILGCIKCTLGVHDIPSHTIHCNLAFAIKNSGIQNTLNAAWTNTITILTVRPYSYIPSLYSYSLLGLYEWQIKNFCAHLITICAATHICGQTATAYLPTTYMVQHRLIEEKRNQILLFEIFYSFFINGHYLLYS